MTSPCATLKTVCLRLVFVLLLGSWYGVEEVTDGGGGGTENKARSWGSVSRIRDVMSVVERRALVNILGGGKLWWG